MPYCSECGEQVGSEVRFCPNCGADVGVRQDETAPDDRTRGSDQPRSGEFRSGRQGGEPQRGGRQTDRRDTPDARTGTAGGQGTGTGTRTGTGTGTATTGGRAAGAGAGAGAAGAATAATQVQTSGSATNPEGPMPFENGAFSHAFGYPTQDDYDPILIGAIIEFVGTFIPFVNFIVRGYGLRLARASARGQVDRPDWGDYGGQFVDGLKLIALQIVFGLAWLLVAGVLGGVAFVASETAGTIVFSLVLFVAALLFPASLTTYAATDSFGAAFSPSKAGAFLTSMSYVKAYVLSAVIMPVYLLVFFISLFTIVGGFVVLAYGTYFFFSFWGYYYRESVANGSAPPAPAKPVTAD